VQLPPVHWLSPQQSEPRVHGTCGAVMVSAGYRQQLVPEGCGPQKYPPQHIPPSGVDIVEHVSPGARQPGARHRPLRHSSPEQHPSFDVHASSICEQAQLPGPVVIPIGRWQRAPPQQSRSLEQVSSRRRHTQRPLVQSIEPQQSRDVPHIAFAPRQQNVPPGCSPQA
jgi:hypothetical protein